MQSDESLVDIHCHLLPGIDDGAKSWDQSLAMARIAAADGIGTIIVTPHQLGNFAHNTGETIRQRTERLNEFLREHNVPLKVLPGADVRIEDDLIERVRRREVLTLADRMKHVLLELPHELYFPLDGLLAQLHQAGLVGILSHPERNQGILKSPQLIAPLVEQGCLMQVTAGSLTGTFGPASQQLSEWMLQRGLVHFVATDAHGPTSRRPLLRRAQERIAEMTDWETALDLCCRNPAQVVAGGEIVIRPQVARRPRRTSWFGWRAAG